MVNDNIYKQYIGKAREGFLRLSSQLTYAPRYFVRTFGCQQNEADSERIRGVLQDIGYFPAEDEKDADIILVNTCAIREHAEKKALSIVGQYKHIKKLKPHLVIGICGCMTAQEHRVEELKHKYPYVSFTLNPSELPLIPKVLSEIYDQGKRIFRKYELPDITSGSLPVIREGKIKAYVSIMYGCNNFCSYCIVPYVRGREISRPSADIIEEVTALSKEGYKDITLLGQNVNSYNGDCTFPELLSRLCRIEGEFVLRFMTSHPKDVSPELIEVVAREDKLAKHFHLPVQSGSNAVLKDMNRRYTREKYLTTLRALRSACPDIAITSDIIVGFPGETEEDFADTLSLMREAEYDMLYSFIYSPRKGTPAAAREDQIPRNIQNERFDRLLLLQNEISEKLNSECIGKVFRVLAEGKSKTNDKVMCGRTDSYKLVLFEGDESVTGKFINIKITHAEPYALHGEII